MCLEGVCVFMLLFLCCIKQSCDGVGMLIMLVFVINTEVMADVVVCFRVTFVTDLYHYLLSFHLISSCLRPRLCFLQKHDVCCDVHISIIPPSARTHRLDMAV